MEVVAATPGAGGVPPFHDHDVREWSRIDSLTGVLERARLETDHWSANTTNSCHKYGKVSSDENKGCCGCRFVRVMFKSWRRTHTLKKKILIATGATECLINAGFVPATRRSRRRIGSHDLHRSIPDFYWSRYHYFCLKSS
jgi:hypothetical protein